MDGANTYLPQTGENRATGYPFQNEVSPSFPAKTAAIPAKVRTADVSSLIAYFDAVQAASDAMVGVLNQPRVSGDIEDVLSERCEALDRECVDIARLIRAATPADDQERRNRAYFLIAFECRCGESVSKIAELAAVLAVKDRN